MNSLTKSSRKLTTVWLKNTTPSLIAVRNHWNKDYQPGPCPRTQEEYRAAAEKYGIPVAEYKPYPDDGFYGAGDYPNFQPQSAEAKDPFYPWDNPELKRNFGEVLHDDFDLLREDRYNINYKFHKPLWVLWVQTVGFLGGGFLIYKVFDQCKMFPAVVPPQIPKQGKVHYTFEPL